MISGQLMEKMKIKVVDKLGINNFIIINLYKSSEMEDSQNILRDLSFSLSALCSEIFVGRVDSPVISWREGHGQVPSQSNYFPSELISLITSFDRNQLMSLP